MVQIDDGCGQHVAQGMIRSVSNVEQNIWQLQCH
jgi:hypothetical protein